MSTKHTAHTVERRPHRLRTRANTRGFTLAELAVVLVIVGLLLGGLLVPLAAQMDARYRSDTEKALSDIREALIGYAIVNGRLPCPADPTIPTTTSNAGVEITTGSGSSLTCACRSSTSAIASYGGTACSGNATGVLPWATLGLPESDVWGNRFTYYVDYIFSRGVDAVQSDAPSKTWTKDSTNHPCSYTADYSGAPTKAAFSLCSYGSITVLPSNGSSVTISGGIPALVVSQGKNGYGAWNTSGSQNDASSSSDDEKDNTDNDSNFVSNTTIDDQLIWISPSILMNRMITAGKLP